MKTKRLSKPFSCAALLSSLLKAWSLFSSAPAILVKVKFIYQTRLKQQLLTKELHTNNNQNRKMWQNLRTEAENVE